MLHSTKRNGGFTLVEVLIAMAIIIVGIVAVMRFFPLGLRQARIAQERTLAAEMADDHLGRLRFGGARNLMQTDGLEGILLTSDFFSAANVGAGAASYQVYNGYETSLQRLHGADEVFLQRVTFTVDMNDGRREQFVTYIVDF